MSFREEYNREYDDMRRQDLKDWVERVLRVEEPQPKKQKGQEAPQPKETQNNETKTKENN